MKPEIKKKNLSLTIESLVVESKKVAKELSVLYKKRSKVKERLIELDVFVKNEKNKLELRGVKILNAEKEIILKQEENLIENKKHEENIEEFKKEESELVKKISWDNEKIASSEDTLEELKKQESVLVEQLEEKSQTLLDIGDLRIELDNLHNQKNVELTTLQNIHLDYSNTLRDIEEATKESSKRLKILSEKSIREEEKLSNFGREYDQKMKDLEIIINRVRVKYEELYPGRKINL